MLLVDESTNDRPSTVVRVPAPVIGTQSWTRESLSIWSTESTGCQKLKRLTPRESPRVPEVEMNEPSRVPRVPEAEMTESSRVPRVPEAEMT